MFEQLPLQERQVSSHLVSLRLIMRVCFCFPSQLWSSHEWGVKNGLVAMPDVEPAVESQALGILANSYSKNIGMVKGMVRSRAHFSSSFHDSIRVVLSHDLCAVRRQHWKR